MVNAESTGPQALSLPVAPCVAPDLVRSERPGELADVAEELLQQGQVTALGGRLAADRIDVLRIGHVVMLRALDKADLVEGDDQKLAVQHLRLHPGDLLRLLADVIPFPAL